MRRQLKCSSILSPPCLFSVPCNPTNVQASLQCLSNSAAVTWERASGAVLYQAVGTTDGGHQAMCNNSQTHCDLSGLQCGQTYNVTVVSKDDTCSSVDSDTAHVRTGKGRIDLYITVDWSLNYSILFGGQLCLDAETNVTPL